MPRSAPKSKAEKHKPKPSVKETTPLQVEQEENASNPQRVNQALWTKMLIQEDTDEVVGEIMEELLSKVMDGCYKVYMERQSYITEVLEHQFLGLDAEGLEEAFRADDSEPMPALPDSWAQGCVPVVHAHTHPPHRTKQQEVDADHAPVHIKQSVQKQSNAKDSLQNQAEKQMSPRKPVSDTQYNMLSPRPPPKTNRQRKQQVTIPPKIVPSKLLPSLSCSTAQQNVAVEGKTMEPKTASRHQHKGCKPIPKLDPLSLPRHWIVSQYEIMDNNTKPNPKKFSGQIRFEPKSNQQQKTLKPLTSCKEQTEYFQSSREDDVIQSKHGKERTVLSGSLRLDTMVLAKGVSVLDPQAVEMNTQKCNHLSQSSKLKAIQRNPPVPPYPVDQVTTSPSARVISLSHSSNCDA